MRTVAVVGQKGGTGKTMLAENLFVEARARGSSAAIIDLDPQASASRWADRRQDGSDAVVSAQPVRLAKVLNAARESGTDLCVIDTPGKATDASLEAAKVADLVLIPVRPFVTDIETLRAVRDLLDLAGRPQAFIVLNAAPVQGKRHDEAREAAKEMGFNVCPVILHQRAAYADAPLEGLGVREHQPKGFAATELDELFRFVTKIMNPKTPKPTKEVRV
jgi:chromosome partitioning protein